MLIFPNYFKNYASTIDKSLAHPLHTQHYTTSHNALTHHHPNSSNTYNTTPSTAMSTSTPTTTHCSSSTTFHKLVELNHQKTQHTANSRYSKKTSQTTAHKPDSPSPCSPGSSYLKSLKRLGILLYGPAWPHPPPSTINITPNS